MHAAKLHDNAIDNDGDGYSENQGDCDDTEPAVNPGATEIPLNGIDDDCNPLTLDDPPLSQTIGIPKTGQTTCYNTAGSIINCAGTGQDGEHQAGVAWPDPRFIDNTDGTVTDNLTGLMWAQDGNLPGSVKTWQQALNYVAGMNAGAYPNMGRTDWRLPNINELASLGNAEVTSVTTWLNSIAFTNIQASYYWSSTTHSYNKNSAWYFCMYCNKPQLHYKNNPIYFLPVRAGQQGVSDPAYPANVQRSGQTACYNTAGSVINCAGTGQDGELQRGVVWPDPRFTDNGDGTVTDNLTSLMWLKDMNCFGERSWQGALDVVADLNNNPGNHGCKNYTANHTDWRLHNKREIFSLIDHQRYSNSLPTGHPFTGPWYDMFWSSTTFSITPSQAWALYIATGPVGPYPKTDVIWMGVWPVRGDSVPLDIDGDGYPESTDCNDSDPNINPGVSEIFGNTIDDDCNPSTPDNNVVPVADAGGPYANTEGVAITLDPSATTDPNLNIYTYEWDVDDNGIYEYIASGTQVHIYPQQGLYNVRLRVTDDLGLTDEATTTVTISDSAPTAGFTGNPLSGSSPLPVNFSNSSKGYDQPLTYEWDFDLNGSTDSTAVSPPYDYIGDGIYSVKLTVTDSDGSINSMTKTSYIDVNSCLSPVRITGSANAYHSLIGTAYSDALDGNEINAQAVSFTEDLIFDLSKAIWLKGGYDCSYSTNPDMTIINGNARIINGVVTLENIRIQ